MKVDYIAENKTRTQSHGWPTTGTLLQAHGTLTLSHFRLKRLQQIPRMHRRCRRGSKGNIPNLNGDQHCIRKVQNKLIIAPWLLRPSASLPKQNVGNDDDIHHRPESPRALAHSPQEHRNDSANSSISSSAAEEEIGEIFWTPKSSSSAGRFQATKLRGGLASLGLKTGVMPSSALLAI